MLHFLASWEVFFQTVLVNALLAFSVQIALRAGVFSLAGVGCWAIGAYTLSILNLRGVNTLVAIVAAVAIACVVSYLLSLVLVRLRGLYLGMATVAFNQMVGVAIINGGELTGGEMGLYGVNAPVTTLQLVIVVGVVCLMLWAMERGVLGRAYNIVRDDESLAESLAIDTGSLRRFAFVLSGAIGALGGALNAMLLGIASPTDADFPVIVIALTMVIVGGFHSWRGALIGAALILWLPIGIQSFGIRGMHEWWSVVYGALILGIAVYFPKGLLGGLQKLRSLVDRRAVREATP
ncbi:MAG: branched-chain amino acid ABC transporter permease [Rhizobiaceae bacterium]|nr:branched-chain amino acid ABC transporter permease [Rhizobiaceae bacterium]